MNRLLLLLLLLPCIGYAQTVEIGLCAGAALFSGMHAGNSHYSHQLKPATYDGGMVAIKFKNYEVGLKVAGADLIGRTSNGYYNAVAYSRNNIMIMLLGNKHKQLGAFDVYGGVSAGYMTYKNPGYTAMAELYPTAEFASSKGNGYMASMQLGCVYCFARRWSAGVEAGAGYCHVNAQNEYLQTIGQPTLHYGFSYISYPVTVGLRYVIRRPQK